METSVETCYRHPDQPAGIVCQRCDRPICPRCMHQASVGFHCPECVKTGKQKVVSGPSAFVSKPVLTQAIIGANVLVFLVGLIGGADPMGGKIRNFDADFGLYAFGVKQGDWWRMFTAGFLHAGVIHIALNMWVLWTLGRAVEHMGGRLRYGVVYVVSLLSGSLVALVMSPNQLTVGASGAIFGLAGAIFVAQRAQGIPFRNSPLLPFLGINLFLTLAIPGISIGGYLGGLLGGAVAGWLLFDLAREPGIDKRLPYALCAGVAIGCVVAGMVFAASYTPRL